MYVGPITPADFSHSQAESQADLFRPLLESRSCDVCCLPRAGLGLSLAFKKMSHSRVVRLWLRFPDVNIDWTLMTRFRISEADLANPGAFHIISPLD